MDIFKIVDDKSKTRDRRMARAVVKHKAPKNIDPSLTPYEGETEGAGPFANIGEFLPDTEEHKRKTIHEQERVRGEKFRKEYYKRRRENAIRRDVAMGRLTKEQAANVPEDYGRALNAPRSGGKRRKRKKERHAMRRRGSARL